MYYVNENIKELWRDFYQENRENYLRLDLNENPGGLPEEFVARVLKNITPQSLSQYPEMLEFTEALAKYLHTDSSRLCLVNGSSEGIRYVIEAFTSPHGKIVGVTPSYAMFEVYAKMYGRTYVSVTYTEELTMPIERILNQLKEDVELLILVNPNNPMGNVYSEEEMKELLAAAKEKQITVLIDEAYFYFYPNSFISYALTEEHIFVTRTFSKMCSLAGARLGYVAGGPEGIGLLKKLCTPHNINVFALKFAQAVIEEEGLLQSLIDIHEEGKAFLIKKLQENGYEFNAQAGNFVFIKPKTNAGDVVERMKAEKRILIKTYKEIGRLGVCLRVTTGAKCYMQQFLDALLEIDAV